MRLVVKKTFIYTLIIILIVLGIIGLALPLVPQAIFFALALILISFEVPWVEEKIENEYPDLDIEINVFPQTQSKEARIRDKAFWIVNHVYFPDDFHITHPLVWKALTEFIRNGKNDHDDAPDSLTILAEMVINPERDMSVWY